MNDKVPTPQDPFHLALHAVVALIPGAFIGIFLFWLGLGLRQSTSLILGCMLALILMALVELHDYAVQIHSFHSRLSVLEYRTGVKKIPEDPDFTGGQP